MSQEGPLIWVCLAKSSSNLIAQSAQRAPFFNQTELEKPRNMKIALRYSLNAAEVLPWTGPSHCQLHYFPARHTSFQSSQDRCCSVVEKIFHYYARIQARGKAQKVLPFGHSDLSKICIDFIWLAPNGDVHKIAICCLSHPSRKRKETKFVTFIHKSIVRSKAHIRLSKVYNILQGNRAETSQVLALYTIGAKTCCCYSVLWSLVSAVERSYLLCAILKHKQRDGKKSQVLLLQHHSTAEHKVPVVLLLAMFSPHTLD